MREKTNRKDLSKQEALGLFRFAYERRWEKRVALFSWSVEEGSRFTEVLGENGFCVVTNNSRGMEDFRRDRGEGRVSGKKSGLDEDIGRDRSGSRVSEKGRESLKAVVNEWYYQTD